MRGALGLERLTPRKAQNLSKSGHAPLPSGASSIICYKYYIPAGFLTRDIRQAWVGRPEKSPQTTGQKDIIRVLRGWMEQANSAPPAVEIVSVVKRFGYLTAVDGVSLTLEKGEFLTIFGPNGAGKTTLIKIMAGLTNPSSGSARINGRPVQDHDDEARRDIGLISHQTFTYGQLTAMENLLFFARLYGVEEPSARCQGLLEEVGLSKRSHEPVRSFSRGMLQRLSIARALVHDPSILLLDEPFTGLDQHAAETLKRQLRRLKDERRTLVMITHNLEQGVALGTRVVLQVAGKFVLDTPAESIDPVQFGKVYFEKVGQEHY